MFVIICVFNLILKFLEALDGLHEKASPLPKVGHLELKTKFVLLSESTKIILITKLLGLLNVSFPSVHEKQIRVNASYFLMELALISQESLLVILLIRINMSNTISSKCLDMLDTVSEQLEGLLLELLFI